MIIVLRGLVIDIWVFQGGTRSLLCSLNENCYLIFEHSVKDVTFDVFNVSKCVDQKLARKTQLLLDGVFLSKTFHIRDVVSLDGMSRVVKF
jgi:hypothetical protein